MKNIYFLLITLIPNYIFSQTNIVNTNNISEQVLLGNYIPSTYTSTTIINHHDSIIRGINNRVNADSLKKDIFKLATFENRNTGSDTSSLTTGIGAARKWVYNRFQSISSQNDNRLLTGYLEFDETICGVIKHKNIFGVLPGFDATNNEIIIVEGHIDSRCSNVCDSLCLAEGIEDNASGTALVLELARVMSKYTYKNTIVFLITTGEEQGLFGSKAFSKYINDNNMPVKAVLNNDVIGGIICGQTSSGPSCPGLNDIDSLQVRFFSAGGANSSSKQLARFVKLEYKEEMKPQVSVPMDITIMAAEDRIGRGGDHIPFRQKGYPAMRMTSANEHGDASAGVGYTDRQHTSDDIVGIDTNGDLIIDSFFIDFNYLARNTVINGNGIAMAAIGPKTPTLSAVGLSGPAIEVNITSSIPYGKYRIGLRTSTNDWDTVYTTTSLLDTIYPPIAPIYFVSVASVDSDNIESLFSEEKFALPTGIKELHQKKESSFELLQNKPNPFDEATIIGVRKIKARAYSKAYIFIQDVNGRLLEKLPISLNNEINEVVYKHGYGKVGVFNYSLVIDGETVLSKKMIFAN